MNVKVEKTEKNTVKLEIEVEAEKFEEAMQKSYFKNVKKYTVQGFRKGKAPRKILERHYGEGILYEDAFNYIGAESYDEAIKENNISTVDSPQIDIVQIGSGKSLIFTAEVTIKPEIEIKKYKGIEIKKVEYNVTDKEVEEEIERIRQKNARIITADDAELKEGDIATIDFEGFIDDIPFEGGKGSDYDLEIGKRMFIEGFEDQLAGMKVNETREIKVTFPEDYHSKHLAGKDAIFKVSVKGIKIKELPALDDEFAKDVSEFDTLKEFKNSIKSKLEKSNEERAKKEMEDQLVNNIVENIIVDIPNVMVERQIDSMIKEFEWKLRFQGADLNGYLNYTNTDYEKFRLQFKDNAQKSIKVQLALEEIAKMEKIEASDEEINDKISDLAKGYSQTVEEFNKRLKEEDIEYIRKEVEIDKTIKFLMDNAKIA